MGLSQNLDYTAEKIKIKIPEFWAKESRSLDKPTPGSSGDVGICVRAGVTATAAARI
jgi:hypothetical protein